MRKLTLYILVLSFLGCVEEKGQQIDDCDNGNVTIKLVDKSSNPYQNLAVNVHYKASIDQENASDLPSDTTDTNGEITISNARCGYYLITSNNNNYTTSHESNSGLYVKTDLSQVVKRVKSVHSYSVTMSRVVFSLYANPSNVSSSKISSENSIWDVINSSSLVSYSGIVSSSSSPLFINDSTQFITQPFKPSTNFNACKVGISIFGANDNSISNTDFNLTLKLYETNLGNDSNLIGSQTINSSYSLASYISYNRRVSFLDLCANGNNAYSFESGKTYWVEVDFSDIPIKKINHFITKIGQSELVGLSPKQSINGNTYTDLNAGYIFAQFGDSTIYDVPKFTMSGANNTDRLNNVSQTPDRFVFEIIAVE